MICKRNNAIFLEEIFLAAGWNATYPTGLLGFVSLLAKRSVEQLNTSPQHHETSQYDDYQIYAAAIQIQDRVVEVVGLSRSMKSGRMNPVRLVAAWMRMQASRLFDRLDNFMDRVGRPGGFC